MGLEQLLERLERAVRVSLSRERDGLLVDLARRAIGLELLEVGLHFGRLLPDRHLARGPRGHLELAESCAHFLEIEEGVAVPSAAPVVRRLLAEGAARVEEVLLRELEPLLRRELPRDLLQLLPELDGRRVVARVDQEVDLGHALLDAQI